MTPSGSGLPESWCKVAVWAQARRDDSAMTMTTDGEPQADPLRRADVVAEASSLALRGSKAAFAGQVAWGRRNRAATDVLVTGGSSPVTIGILCERGADAASAVRHFLELNNIHLDEPSDARVRHALSALDLATRTGCLGAMLR